MPFQDSLVLLAYLTLAPILCSFTNAAPAASCTLPVLPTDLVVASGYAGRRVASGLRSPRSLKFDSQGNLLVVDRGKGIRAFSVNDEGGDCVSLTGGDIIVPDSDLNHGLELSPKSGILYASTRESVYSYPYNAATTTVTTASRRTLINNMTNPDHITRTLLLSTHSPGQLIVARGSGGNLDPISADVSSGRAQIRSFRLSTARTQGPLDYASHGTIVASGTRNEVGIAEHPSTGGVWGVENSADNLSRDGVDIHENDPGEELNSFGPLSSLLSGTRTAANYGYPTCFAAWDVKIPQAGSLQPGMQFAIGDNVGPTQDSACAQRQAPRLMFKPHQAPLDIKFNGAGSVAWVTFHGSHDRTVPDGYKIGTVKFDAASGQPVAPSTSKQAVFTVMSNKNPNMCNPQNCMRPVGIAFDKKGRLFFTSDDTGEIFIITNADGSGVF